MILAVTYENGLVFPHFGHTSQFKLYQIENGVQALICGGIGGGAREALAQAGIALYPGVAGEADRAVEALLAGQLAYDADAVCDHHEHDHGQDCSAHRCAQDHQGCTGNHLEG